MEIKSFECSYLEDVKKLLKAAFYRENSNAVLNEWEFAETVLQDAGYKPYLCLIAVEKDEVIGYNILTAAAIGEQKGLALGPLAVKEEYQNKGIGTRLVRESIQRAQESGYPWIAVLGGDYYSRFGFKAGRLYGITVSDNAFENDHIQILFLNRSTESRVSGKIIYCNSFYDSNGNLL